MYSVVVVVSSLRRSRKVQQLAERAAVPQPLNFLSHCVAFDAGCRGERMRRTILHENGSERRETSRGCARKATKAAARYTLFVVLAMRSSARCVNLIISNSDNNRAQSNAVVRDLSTCVRGETRSLRNDAPPPPCARKWNTTARSVTPT